MNVNEKMKKIVNVLESEGYSLKGEPVLKNNYIYAYAVKNGEPYDFIIPKFHFGDIDIDRLMRYRTNVIKRERE